MKRKTMASVLLTLWVLGSSAWAEGGGIAKTTEILPYLLAAAALVLALVSTYSRRKLDAQSDELSGLVRMLGGKLERCAEEIEIGRQARLKMEQLAAVGQQAEGVMKEVEIQLAMADQIVRHHLHVAEELKVQMTGAEVPYEQFEKTIEQMESSQSLMRKSLGQALERVESFRIICGAAFNDERSLTDVGALVDEVVSMIQHRLDEMEVKVVVDVPERPVDSFPGGIAQILLQLFLSSMAYGKQGNVRITGGFTKKQFFLTYADNRMIVDRERLPVLIAASKESEEEWSDSERHILMVKRVVEDKLGGTFRLDSLPDRGITIGIRLQIVGEPE